MSKIKHTQSSASLSSLQKIKASIVNSANSVKASLNSQVGISSASSSISTSSASIINSLKASATQSLQNTPAYSLAQVQHQSFVNNLTLSNARDFIRSYATKQTKNAEKINPIKINKIMSRYNWTMRAKKNGRFKPWMKKNINAYQSASSITQSYANNATSNVNSYSKSLSNILIGKRNKQVSHNIDNLNHSRVFIDGEKEYQKAPEKAIKKFHQQQQRYLYHQEDDKYAKLNGLTTLMHQQGKLDDEQFCAVKDTIRTRYLIKHNHPEVQNDAQMKKYASEAQPVLDQNAKVYGSEIRPEEAIDNPMYQKLMNYTQEFQGGIQNELQRIDQTTSSIDKSTAERHNYVQKISKEINKKSKYSISSDPVIHKAQKVINKGKGVKSRLDKDIRKKWELKIGRKDVNMNLIAKRLYPNDAQLITHNIYQYQLNQFLNNSRTNNISLGSKALNVMKTYQEAKEKGMLKDPKVNKPANKVIKDIHRPNKVKMEIPLLRKLGIGLPDAYVDKAKAGILKVGNKVRNGIKDKMKHSYYKIAKVKRKPRKASRENSINLEKEIRNNRGMHLD